MRLVVTGRSGQLGRQIAGDVVDLPRIDVQDRAIVAAIVAARPDVVIHAAAWTDVDGCARDPDRAIQVNGLGTRNVALGARRAGAVLVYVSTNEVFDGCAETPYDEWSPIHPANSYGRSKAIGETFVRELVGDHRIVRTSWVFGPGGSNFVTKALALADRGPVRMVADEWGLPTYAPDLAAALVDLAAAGVPGTFHLTNEGATSRYDYARAIYETAGITVDLSPIPLATFDRPSRVPPRAVLRNVAAASLGIRLRPWQDALAEYLAGTR